jgi:FtsZ-interacting cell division protein ZipA
MQASNRIVSFQEIEYMQLSPTDPRLIIGIVVLVVIIAIVVAVIMRERKKKTERLRSRFGSEYDRTVTERGSERNAQATLAAREDRVEHLKIHDLAPVERERFLSEWQSVQSRFVDHPRGSVIEADELVASLMHARGYPVADFEQRAADISVNHPRVVENYRSAHAIAQRPVSTEITTEDMRTAMLQYRALFDELLQVNVPSNVAAIA